MADSSFGPSPEKAKGLGKKKKKGGGGIEIPITQLMTVCYMDKCNGWLTPGMPAHAPRIRLHVGGSGRGAVFLFRGIRCLWR